MGWRRFPPVSCPRRYNFIIFLFLIIAEVEDEDSYRRLALESAWGRGKTDGLRGPDGPGGPGWAGPKSVQQTERPAELGAKSQPADYTGSAKQVKL